MINNKMDRQISSLNIVLKPLDLLLNSLRAALCWIGIISAVRVLRPMIHFGPWRVIPIFLIRQLRPKISTPAVDSMSLLDTIDTAGLVEELQKNSVVVAGKLPAEFVRKVRVLTDCLPVDEYKQMYYVDENIRRVADDPAIRNVLRAYFKCEPVLLESTVAVTKQARSKVLTGQNLFHRDYAGWQSLNVFIYLTDVTEESSYHIVAKGSHRNVRFRDHLKRNISVEAASRRFGDSIQPILGQAGTVFFENTEAYHRRHSGKGNRVFVNLLYASHRSWFSHGRASKSDIRKSVTTIEQMAKNIPRL